MLSINDYCRSEIFIQDQHQFFAELAFSGRKFNFQHLSVISGTQSGNLTWSAVKI